MPAPAVEETHVSGTYQAPQIATDQEVLDSLIPDIESELGSSNEPPGADET